MSGLPERYDRPPLAVELSGEQRAARERARQYVREELIPRESEVGEVDALPADLERHLNDRAKALGLWAPATPVELGGGGLGELGHVLLREQVANAVLADIRQERGIGGDPWPALYAAQGEMRERYLMPHIRGEKTMFFALTEPGAGSDAASLKTRAEWTGSAWRITGRKHFIGRGGTADFGIVFASTDADKGARGGITCFAVDRGTPGFTHVRDIETMGACRPTEIAFDGCLVPPENVLGEVGQGFVLASKTLARTRLRQASMSLGVAQRALDETLAWVAERRTFGKLLKEREIVRARLARAAVDLRAARLMTYAIAGASDRGENIRAMVPAAKTLAAQTAWRITDLAVQLHGAVGIGRDRPVERLYRDVRSFRITEGSDEVQRSLIARELLATTR
jgi:acyl-CoA dehydrogenase